MDEWTNDGWMKGEEWKVLKDFGNFENNGTFH